ncbi:hypothetical protein EJB05_28690, partial [Eragrostis curvula]
MSAPPPPSAFDDYYDDDGIDWEAAVLEIDKVCALRSASASAPAPAPVQQQPPPRPPQPSATAPVRKPSAPAGGGTRQSTLDRFVNPSTSGQREREKPAPAPVSALVAAQAGGSGHRGARAGEGCSRPASEKVLEDRFMESFSLRREKEKAASAPAPVVTPARGRGRCPRGRAGKGGPRRVVEEVSYGPCAVALDHEAVQTWIYPTNVDVREYQKYMVEKALFTNTLIALPTGLGKTFIAAVVMYNYFRWFPEGKIIFTAPSRPLVTQQIEACHNTVGIPQEWTIEMKGSTSPSSRVQYWKSKRVFFVTPQVLANDIHSGICMVKQIVCLVIDEAHRASGNFAYCTALVAAHVPLRILALTATPGSKHASIQSVINNLCISDLVYCDEEDSQVSRYINTRKVELVKVPFGSDATEIDNMLLDIMRPRLNRLRDAGVIDHRDYANVIESDAQERTLLSIKRQNEAYVISRFTSENTGIDKSQNADSKESRVIIFSHFRGSVKEIYLSLQAINDRLIRPVEFIGQSAAGKRMKGQTQKMQQAILQKFRSGEYNVLVATSIGEEGLDIIEVDLVICFDANVSPLRMIQRMGRTGRKHEGQVDILCDDDIECYQGHEVKGYSKKQGDTRTMRKLLRNSERFEYHASPRMVPHIFKPEIKCVKLTIEKYTPCVKKIKVTVNGSSPVLRKMSEEDGQLIARYFGAHREGIWRPSLVAFPRFQLSPSVVHKVSHSFRTTDMLIDAMQQLQDVSFFRTKCESPFQEPADIAAVKDQSHEGLGLNGISGNKDTMPQECDSLEASSREMVWDRNVPSSTVKMYPIHSFFSGDYVTVDREGNVSITFVPVLRQISACHKDTKNASSCLSIQKMAVTYKSAAEFSKPTVEFDCPAYLTDSGKHMLKNSVSNLAPRSCDCAGQGGNVDDYVLTTPSKTLTSPRDKWDTPCSAILASSAVSGPEDKELSPRLTHYMEEGIVPDSPVLDVSHLQELGGAVDVRPVSKIGSSRPLADGYQRGPFWHEKNDGWLSGNTELAISSRHDVLEQTRAQAEAEEPACPSNVRICTPVTHTSTNLLCDSFSNDCHLKSGVNTSGSVQQAPKYRRLCKYGDKIKRVPSISLDSCHDGFGGITSKNVPNQMEHGIGNKGRAKRRLDTYIDEEVEVSQDADVSEDEDDNQSEDKYEDSFIDDQATPTGEFTQSEQGNENNGDMMGFYRQSLLTQTPVVLPSRYLDASDSSSRARNASCSSDTRHNSVETPKGLPPKHHTMEASPLWYQQRSMERASIIHQQSETAIDNCESSSKMDFRKRKLSFQQSASIPVINLEPETARQPSSHLGTGVSDDFFLDDAFFEGLDLDAIEAQATEQWRQKTAQSIQKPVEAKKASEISFAPPSFDLGF